MDYKFLNKVIDQIVSETTIDYGRGKIHTPYHLLHLCPIHFLPSPSRLLPPHYFTHHCKEIYGLNEDEVNYVWVSFKKNITNKLNNGL